MLNAGIIGLGIGEKHALAYINHNRVDLKSVCDFEKTKLNHFHSNFPHVDTSHLDQTILKDKSIDIISVASYDNYHAEQIVEAFRNGKHVIAEKPICLNQEELVQIQKAQKFNPKLKLTANHVLRTNSRFIRLKSDIKKGEFGDLFYLEGDYYWGRKKKLFEWRAELELYSIIYGAAIHMIDLVMWLIGSRPLNVFAMGNDIATRESNQKNNSFAVILLQFENGIIAKLTGNGGCIHPHFHGLKIFGTKRTMIQHIEGAYYFDSSDSEASSTTIREPYPEKETRQKIIHSFIDSILDTSIHPVVDDQSVYDIMSVCFAAEDAMNSGSPVNIEYLNM